MTLSEAKRKRHLTPSPHSDTLSSIRARPLQQSHTSQWYLMSVWGQSYSNYHTKQACFPLFLPCPLIVDGPPKKTFGISRWRFPSFTYSPSEMPFLFCPQKINTIDCPLNLISKVTFAQNLPLMLLKHSNRTSNACWQNESLAPILLLEPYHLHHGSFHICDTWF